MSTVNTVPELLRAQASRIPEQPFVRWRGRSVSYSEFDARTDALATGLADSRRQARRRGFRDAPQLPGVLGGMVGDPEDGGRVRPHQPRVHRAPEAAYVVGHSRAVAVVTDARGAGTLAGAAGTPGQRGYGIRTRWRTAAISTHSTRSPVAPARFPPPDGGLMIWPR